MSGSDHPTVTLLFGGDFAPLGAYEPLIAARGGAIFGAAQALIAEADFTLFNLETPLCAPGPGIAKSGPAIRATPATLQALVANGVDAVCLANNHILDFGAAGLNQTLAALDDHAILHTGAGPDRASAEAPLRLTLEGRRVSIFSFAEREFNLDDDGQAGAALLDPLRMAPLLLAERKQAEALIVCVHAGNEYFPWPRPGLRKLCQFLIDMGADAVIGHHPHVPGPYELYRGRPIFYSLGNLVFDRDRPPADWDMGYLVRLELIFGPAGVQTVSPQLFPYRQCARAGGVDLLPSVARDAFLTRIEAMRSTLETRPQDWLATWQGFVGARSRQAEIDLSSPLRFPGLRRLLGFRPLRNLITPPARRQHRINLLRCPSHYELVLAALERGTRQID